MKKNKSSNKKSNLQSKRPLKLSILIPAYNEQKTISQIINAVKKVKLRDNMIKEIIVIDDGSKDDTVKIVKNIPGVILVEQKRNQGKGAAIRAGIHKATGDIILIQDADLEYNPKEYNNLITPIIEGKTKVVYGSRFLRDIQKRKNIIFVKKHNKAYLMAYIGGRLITLTTNVLFLNRITDEPTCYKVFDSKVIKNIPFKGNRFEWEPEVTAKIYKNGYRIHEVPITYHPRTFEEGKKINWKDGVQAIWTLIKYRFVN